MNFLGEKIKEKKMPNNVGVLICNLGTPESYGYIDVRKFLKEFISVIKESRYADGILKLNNDLVKIGWKT